MEAGKPAVPAFGGMTKEEANLKNIECKKKPSFFGCTEFSEQSPTPAIPAEPDKEVTREATKNEYDKCLRQNGL